MQIELIIALLSGAVALVGALIAVFGQLRSARFASELEALQQAEQRRLDTEKVVARYREPLARAAYDLQSRLYNILQQHLIETYLRDGDPREQAYVVDNTAFLVAQYFAWTEIIRRDIQHIDLGQDDQTRKLARLQDHIYGLFQSDDYDRVLRVFAGEQRAIGERMIQEGSRGLECAGYATFLDRIATSPDPLLEPIREDVRRLTTQLDNARPRLVALQHALIDLLSFLDPQHIRFPESRCTKVGNQSFGSRHVEF
jgi:hypothetical protein